jgi:hypothetical protein
VAVLHVAANWNTISSLATGLGTLVLAVATFASVRSANRSARVAEEALLEQRRPVLAPSRFGDPVQKIMFVERHWVRAEGGRGVAEHRNGNIYLAISLRNVGAGIGVCQAWAARGGIQPSGTVPHHLPEAAFRTQTRDLYIPAGDLGMWQGALRDPEDPAHAEVAEAIDTLEPITIELLYSDQVGGQRTITRFGLVPYSSPDTGEVAWTATTSRHWFLDRPGPRSESAIEERAKEILRRIEAGVEGESESEEAAGAEAEAVEGAPPGEGGEPVTAIPRPNCE